MAEFNIIEPKVTHADEERRRRKQVGYEIIQAYECSVPSATNENRNRTETGIIAPGYVILLVESPVGDVYPIHLETIDFALQQASLLRSPEQLSELPIVIVENLYTLKSRNNIQFTHDIPPNLLISNSSYVISSDGRVYYNALNRWGEYELHPEFDAIGTIAEDFSDMNSQLLQSMEVCTETEALRRIRNLAVKLMGVENVISLKSYLSQDEWAYADSLLGNLAAERHYITDCLISYDENRLIRPEDDELRSELYAKVRQLRRTPNTKYGIDFHGAMQVVFKQVAPERYKMYVLAGIVDKLRQIGNWRVSVVDMLQTFDETTGEFNVI